MNHPGHHLSMGEKALRTMYRALLSLLVVGLFVSMAGGQQVRPDERVSLIRQRYNDINGKLGTYRKVKKNGIEIDSESSGNMEAYLAGREVRKIVFLLHSESSRWQMDYYYWAGNLIFAYQKKVQMNMETMRPAYTEERRLYFAEGKLIKLLIDKADVSLNDAKYDAEYKRDVDNTVKLSNDLVAAAQAK